MYWVRVPMTGGLIWVISLFKELVSFQQSPIAEGDEEEKTNGNPVSSGHIYNIYIYIGFKNKSFKKCFLLHHRCF